MVSFQYRAGSFLVSVCLCQACYFILKDIGEPFDEYQREDVVLEFRCVLFAANGAGGFPKKAFHRLRV